MKSKILKIAPIILTITPIVISVISLFFSISDARKNRELTEKYDILNTYSTKLSYSIEISHKNGTINFDGFNLDGGQITITPKTGGISKTYALHYQLDNIKAILPVELYNNEIMHTTDASDQVYALGDYTVDNIANDSNYLYGTLYIVIEDYANNHYTNMIVFKVNKNDHSWDTTIYNQMDLLFTYNNDIKQIPDFDFDQMKEYKKLTNKLKEIY